jgi:hypothetical protein
VGSADETCVGLNCDDSSVSDNAVFSAIPLFTSPFDNGVSDPSAAGGGPIEGRL